MPSNLFHSSTVFNRKRRLSAVIFYCIAIRKAFSLQLHLGIPGDIAVIDCCAILNSNVSRISLCLVSRGSHPSYHWRFVEDVLWMTPVHNRAADCWTLSSICFCSSVISMPIIPWAKIENAPHWNLTHKEEQFNMFCFHGVHTELNDERTVSRHLGCWL